MSQYNIEAVPLARLFIATDAYKRLRLSADVIELFSLHTGSRVSLGYDYGARAIALRPAASAADPTAGTVDQAGYISARPFYDRTQIEPKAARYYYEETTNDGWYVFVSR